MKLSREGGIPIRGGVGNMPPNRIWGGVSTGLIHVTRGGTPEGQPMGQHPPPRGWWHTRGWQHRGWKKWDGECSSPRRRRTVNPLRGKMEFLANETIKLKPNEVKTRRNPREGIYGDRESQKRSKRAPNEISSEAPAGKFQQRSQRK